MPAVSVSMVCEATTANVTAALRESLSVGVGVGGSGGGVGVGSVNNASCSSPVTATLAATATGIAGDTISNGITSVAIMLPNGSCTTATATTTVTTNGATNDAEDDCLQSKLVASAKRVLLSKVDYEEVDSYGHTVLDTLKTKYIVLKPNALINTNNIANGITNGTENGHVQSPATCNTNGSCTAAAVGGANLTNGGGTANKDNSDCNGNSIASTTTATSTTTTVLNNRAATTTSNTGTGNAANGTGGAGLRRPSAHELPQPKRILFPRENVRIGWKNGTRKWQIGAGMMNVGNTCYLNSTLQAIFHVPSMANWLASESQHMERCDSGGDSGCIICAVCKTLLMAQTHTSPIRPYYVYSKLRAICKHLVMGRQEDAHEFLRYLVEAMEKSYLTRFRNYKELDQYSKETTPMNQILGGYLKSAVRCLSCNHVSVTFQHFQDLLLDIRKADTVEEALDGYFSRERLEDMGYKCESCKKKVSATKQFTLERAPIALCIQLKRFSMMGSKLNKQIVIRPRLDLSKYLTRRNSNEQYTYKLVSMITHLGASQHCGHYTAIGLTESGAYYNFDDSCVRPISVQGVCNTNAYIMFYEMDNPPSTSTVTTPSTNSTQTSNLHIRDTERSNGNNSYSGKTNGMPISMKNINNNMDTTQSQRMIGPQLPPGGLQTYSTTTTNGSSSNGGIKLKNVLSNCSAASTTNSTTTGSGGYTANGNGNGNSKIMIHFKNGQATIKSNASSTSTTTSSLISSSNSVHLNKCTNNNNQLNGNHTTTTKTTMSSNQQNGLHLGTGKFQESTNTKSSLASSSGKSGCSSLEKISNITESSCNSDPEVDDGVSSTTVGYSDCAMYEVVVASSLPSMPNLFDDDVEKSKHFHHQHETTATNNNDKNGNGNGNGSKTYRNSLVPYDLESDDDNAWNTTTKRHDNQMSAMEKINENSINNDKITKRNNSTSTSTISTEDASNGSAELKVDFTKSMKILNSYNNSTNNDATKRTSSPQSKFKIKTENPIDNIFNTSAKGNGNANNTTTNNNNGHTHNGLKNQNGSSNKSLKRKSTSPQNNLPIADTPTTPTYDGYESESEEKHKPNATPPRTPYKRPHLTPSSPPLIQTKTGLWQVTNINTETINDHNCDQPKKTKESATTTTTTTTISSPSSPTTPPKTWINPFASKPSSSTAENKTSSPHTQQRQTTDKRMQFSGNGYKSGLATDVTFANGNGNTVSELLQQSHRGYGAPVLKWNGEENDIEQEIKSEVRDQRQHELNDDDDSEIDRGRQKKVKLQSHGNDAALDRTPGFNPFQEQDNQRRWKSNGNSNNNDNTANNSSSNNNNNSNNNGSNPYRYYNSNYRQQPYQRNKFKYQRYNYNKYQRPVQQQSNGQRHNAEISNGGGNNSNNNSINNYTSRRES